MEQSVQFRVLVLGPFGLECDGAPVDVGAWQHRVVTLLKLLVVAPNRQRRRDDLIDVLWPEADGDTGAGNLRMLVHRLRLAFGGRDPSTILSEHGWVMLNPAYRWDLDLELLESLTRDGTSDLGTLESGAALYRGEPLVEDRYEEWAIPVRERAGRAWRDLCLRLAALQQERDAPGEAVPWLERALEADPFDEPAFVQLLVALHGAGRAAEALQRYERFRERLLRELDVLPDEKLRRLAEELREKLNDTELEVALTGTEGPDEPFIGRDAEIERVAAMADAVADGMGRLLFVEGEAGVGKTRLLDEVKPGLSRHEFVTVSSRCYARHQAVPYYPFLELAASLHAAAPAALRAVATVRWPALAWLLPDPSNGKLDDRPREQHQVFAALADFLKGMAADHPVAIVLDDLQWADEGSLALLHYLACSTRSARVLLLAAYRDVDVGRDHPLAQMVRDLDRDGLSGHLSLQRLGPDATATLVDRLLPESGDVDDLAAYVYRRTKGNPFFIHRLLHTLGRRYRLVRQVGAGGMGRVFEAIDMETDDRVAVKLIFSRTEADPRAMLRFRQESAALEHLAHPNIVKVRGTVVDQYACCIVMDLLPGTSLADLMRPDPPSLGLAKHVVQQIAAALAFAHEHGVVHRDIKPQNVMVADDGHATVTDFGIARMLQREESSVTLTSTGMTMGTPLYMAPEQLEGRRVDHRADIYGLGAVIYEMVTGRPPFEGDAPLAVALQTLRDDPSPPSSVNPAVPAEWDDFILRALSKAPADRFQTARAMEAAISTLPTTERVVNTPAAEAQAGLPDIDPAPPLAGRNGRRRLPTGKIVVAAGTVLAVTIALGVATQIPTSPLYAGGHTSTRSPSSSFFTQSPTGNGPGQFHGPSALALDRQGNVYVTDTGNNRVQEVSPEGMPLRQWGTHGKRTVQFDTPIDIAVTSHGAVYVDDRGNQRIEKLSPAGRQLDEILGYTGSLATDAHDNILIVNVARRHAWKLSWNHDALGDWQLTGVGGTRSPFRAGVTFDGQGRILVCDRAGDRVVEFAVRGSRSIPVTAFPRASDKYHLHGPSDVAVDQHGNIYIADTRHDRIVKLSYSGQLLTYWGKPGDLLGQFNQPSSLAVDGNGNVYVTDYYNDRVQKFSPDGRALWATSGLHPVRGAE